MWHAKQREATGLVVSAVYAAKGRPAKRAIDSIYSLPGKIYSIVLSDFTARRAEIKLF
jgi:hypothetical protein